MPFFKTKVTFEVLSQGEIGDLDLLQIAVECNDGAFVGGKLTLEPIELTAPEAVKALKEAGSEPAFFNIDDDGKSLDEDATVEGDRRILATFHPQAWQNDYAIDVDPEGETDFDVTDEILAMGKEKAVALKDDQYETDALRYAKAAPKWVQDWNGPFYVEVAEAVEEYFAEEVKIET
jgi:hypothetical protein